MHPDEGKRAAALAAVDLVESGTVIGVGTGSTANHFIDGLARRRDDLEGAVASSAATEARLREAGIRVLDLNDVSSIPLYVDGADEATRARALVKGGGGALTREKIVASASERFVCILHEVKIVYQLGAFPLPVEVIPMAREVVARGLRKLGGQPRWREGFVTDNGNVILDVRAMRIYAPAEIESRINQLPGVVTNGLFARRPADLLLVGGAGGVEEI